MSSFRFPFVVHKRLLFGSLTAVKTYVSVAQPSLQVMKATSQFRLAIESNKMKYLGNPQSGSQAQTTASHNRAGQYLRSRRSPVQPVGTGRKAIVKANFSAASKAWSALSPANQASWNSYAAGHPITDALGQSITLTGHQSFVGIASQLLNCGSILPTAVPVSSAVTAPVVTVFTMTHLGVMTLTLGATGSASDFILVSFSAPQSAGVTFCKTFWQMMHLPANSAGAATYGAAYIVQFGTVPAGSKIFLQITPVNQYGVSGTPVQQVAVVV